MPSREIMIDVTLFKKPKISPLVRFINWLFSIFNSRYSLIAITEIQFVCNNCENDDVDCSVVGGNDGILVVYVSRCQNCADGSSLTGGLSEFGEL